MPIEKHPSQAGGSQLVVEKLCAYLRARDPGNEGSKYDADDDGTTEAAAETRRGATMLKSCRSGGGELHFIWLIYEEEDARSRTAVTVPGWTREACPEA